MTLHFFTITVTKAVTASKRSQDDKLTSSSVCEELYRRWPPLGRRHQFVHCGH